MEHSNLKLPNQTIYEQWKNITLIHWNKRTREKCLVTKQSECAPSEDSDQPGHPTSLIRVFAVRMKKAWTLSYPLSAQRRLWSDWAVTQADLSLRWAHSHIAGFVTRRLKWYLRKSSQAESARAFGMNKYVYKRHSTYNETLFKSPFLCRICNCANCFVSNCREDMVKDVC